MNSVAQRQAEPYRLGADSRLLEFRVVIAAIAILTGMR
jgi:hypothetical protein